LFLPVQSLQLKDNHSSLFCRSVSDVNTLVL
jgi:hypothetical protein